jgi:hypothetical protein
VNVDYPNHKEGDEYQYRPGYTWTCPKCRTTGTVYRVVNPNPVEEKESGVALSGYAFQRKVLESELAAKKILDAPPGAYNPTMSEERRAEISDIVSHFDYPKKEFSERLEEEYKRVAESFKMYGVAPEKKRHKFIDRVMSFLKTKWMIRVEFTITKIPSIRHGSGTLAERSG